MPDASVNLAPTSPEAPEGESPSPSWHGITRSTGSRRPPRSARSPRPRRRWLTWLRVIALIVLLPVIALGIGLGVAWVVHQIRGNPSVTPAVQPSPKPSASAVKTPPPSPPAPKVTVPSDWVTESDPPAGLTFRHPAGWIRRTALPEIVRFAPASPGSTTPGIEGVGAGIEQSASPAAALAQFVTRAYGDQPQLQKGLIAAVAGGHPGELQETVTYVRAGVPVRVVAHAFASGNHAVVAFARAASAEATRAAQLEAFVEASVQLTG